MNVSYLVFMYLLSLSSTLGCMFYIFIYKNVIVCVVIKKKKEEREINRRVYSYTNI